MLVPKTLKQFLVSPLNISDHGHNLSGGVTNKPPVSPDYFYPGLFPCTVLLLFYKPGVVDKK